MTDFGFEVEVRSNGEAVREHLYERGLVISERLHAYHCGCDECRYDHEDGAFAAQRDCTVDAEFVSRILKHGSRRANRAVHGIAGALQATQAEVHGHTGCHVHVSKDGLDRKATVRLWRLFNRYHLALDEIASGGQSRVRTYNSPPRPVPESDGLWAATEAATDRYGGDHYYRVPDGCSGNFGGSWLVQKQNTYEFRLWNATRMAWRMKTYIGLSVAMVEAAIAGADTHARDPRPVEAVLRDHLSDDAWAGIIRQRYSKGGMAA